MKKALRYSAAALAACLALSSCTGGQAGQDEGNLVYTSIYPLYEFASTIAGEHADVRLLVPAGAEPHDWEPTPQDRVGLEKAMLLVYNGGGLEHWTDDVVPELAGKGLYIVEASQGLLEEWDDDGGEEEDGHGHSHVQDPHVWLSPLRADRQAEAIMDALCEADPDNADGYRERYGALSARFQALDAAYREALAPLPGRTIVVAHKAFGYLCADYGLEQVSAKGFSPDQEPDPVQMAQTVDYCRENNVRTIFFEEAADPRIAQVIAAEIGAETAVLNTLESVGPDAGEDYFSLMEANLEALVAALS